MNQITRIVSAESRLVGAINDAADRLEAVATDAVESALERLRLAGLEAGARLVGARETGCRVLTTLLDAFGDLTADLEADLEAASRPALPTAERRLADITERDRTTPPALEWPAVEAAPALTAPEPSPEVPPAEEPAPLPEPSAPSDPDGPDPMAAGAAPGAAPPLGAARLLGAREARLDAFLGEEEPVAAAAVPPPEPSANGKRGGKRTRKGV
jgi:hypothetical protein